MNRVVLIGVLIGLALRTQDSALSTQDSGLRTQHSVLHFVSKFGIRVNCVRYPLRSQHIYPKTRANSYPSRFCIDKSCNPKVSLECCVSPLAGQVRG